jgi:hypothetical protein
LGKYDEQVGLGAVFVREAHVYDAMLGFVVEYRNYLFSDVVEHCPAGGLASDKKIKVPATYVSEDSMADISMMLLTVLAAGAVVVGTGFVAVRSDSSKQNFMSRSSGNTYVVLGLSSSGNLKTFEKVVHSELDDAPGDVRSSREGLPGYNVIVRDCQTDDADGAWRRYRSYLQEARNASNRGLRAGIVVDAYGLLAMLLSMAKPGGSDYLPDFVVAMSPIDAKTNLQAAYETMACERPGEPKDTGTVEQLEKMRDLLDKLSDEEKAALRTNASKVEKIVLASIESPFDKPEYMDSPVQFQGTATRGFLTFDKNDVCASWMKGGFTAEELAQARVERERLEKESRTAEPRFAEEVAAEAKRAKEAVFRADVRGRKYCKGMLKSAVDDLVRKIADLSPSPLQKWTNEREDSINDSVRGVFDAAERRRVAEEI